MSIKTEIKFKSILLYSLQNDPLIDRAIFDIIYSYNDFHKYNWLRGLYFACLNEHKNMTLLMVKMGANYYDKGMCGACK